MTFFMPDLTISCYAYVRTTEMQENGAKSNQRILYEVLKSIQAQVGLLRDDMEDNVKGLLTSIDTRLALAHTDTAHQSERLDRLEFRIARLETRLPLTDEKQ
jgi:hypothetical protein